jgi:hypothetical protein
VATGEGRGHSRKQFVAFTVASSPMMNGWAKVTHYDVVKAPKHVRKVTRWLTPVSSSESAVSVAPQIHQLK